LEVPSEHIRDWAWYSRVNVALSLNPGRRASTVTLKFLIADDSLGSQPDDIRVWSLHVKCH